MELPTTPPFRAAAEFTALVTYPVDLEARKRLVRAESYRLLREAADNRKSMPSMVPLEYLSINPKWADGLHKNAMRIFLGERMLAAEYGLARLCDGFIKERGGEGVELREAGESLGPLTAQSFGAWALRQRREITGRSDNPDKGYPKSFQQRAWRYSKPVLHLVIAYLCAVRGDLGQDSIAALFGDPSQIADLLESAELCRERLLKLSAAGNFELREEETIRALVGIKKIPSG